MEKDTHGKRVALVAGVTGIVGLSLAELLVGTATTEERPDWRVYGVARRPRPSWFTPHIAAFLQCDLLDQEQTLATLSPLTDITHLFFTTWTNRVTEEANVEANSSMLRNTLDALLPHATGLRHVSLLTGTKHYLGSFDTLLAPTSAFTRTPQLRMFREDGPRLPGPNFYYSQEDILLAAASSGQFTWNVHRAATIIGVSPIAFVNVAFFLASYAVMCKEEGIPFRFPGDRISWESHTEFTDTYLIAEQQIWAATHHLAHNQAFNVSNGDVAPWTALWPAIASFFDLEVPAYTGEPMRLANAMQGKAHVWESIVCVPLQASPYTLGENLCGVVSPRFELAFSSTLSH
ncbi:hypothetical protein L7F22_038162 [Adiantum nelumboides]|nr:hypothetical protein [Adiantum nelumboides]